MDEYVKKFNHLNMLLNRVRSRFHKFHKSLFLDVNLYLINSEKFQTHPSYLNRSNFFRIEIFHFLFVAHQEK